MNEKFLNNPELLRLAKLHPCLGREANSKFGRLHLPVSPFCNIQCRFCRRCINKAEQRPGVTCTVLTPEQALQKVGKALLLCPQITVVGIAGPGDTLATDSAVETFRLVDRKYPQLIKCLSTNGLMLPQKAKQLIEAGVRTVTVTVNAVEPEIGAKIVSNVTYSGAAYTGVEAAEILIPRQLKGIRLMNSLGAVVKVNTVLVPGINDGHIGAIAKTVKAAGADILNIIPLIPQHEFSAIEAPSCREIEKARHDAEKYITVFRHCQHCRADACGIPGKGDLSSQLYENVCAETFSHG